MKQRTFRVYGIRWDATREERKSLPKEMEVTVTEADVDDISDDYEVEDYILDHISDETGFCHNGFRYEETNIQ